MGSAVKKNKWEGGVGRGRSQKRLQGKECWRKVTSAPQGHLGAGKSESLASYAYAHYQSPDAAEQSTSQTTWPTELFPHEAPSMLRVKDHTPRSGE